MHHYPEEDAMGLCPGRPEILDTQGSASDWVKAETDKYKIRIGLGKPRKSIQNPT
jgi:hypothetical protein